MVVLKVPFLVSLTLNVATPLLFVFEIDGAKTEAANEVLLNEVEEADVYIGLIGQHYGNIYDDGVSATEYEYNTFIADKHDAYFFVKDCKTRDEGSTRFLERIGKVTNMILSQPKRNCWMQLKIVCRMQSIKD